MKLALISPIDLLGWTEGYDNYHLILPHLLTDETYFKFYAYQAKGHKTLDNGEAEGIYTSSSKLFQLAELVGANEIVIPDVIGDTERTIEFAQGFKPYALAHPKFKYMGVAQGQTIDEVGKCLSYMSSQAWINVIALPRHLVKTLGPFARVVILERYEPIISNSFEAVHCLGMGKFLREPQALATLVPPVRSIDTSLPFCLEPSARVLKTNLVWEPVGDIVQGDELVGFDEEFNNGTTMRPTKVLATRSFKASCYRITTKSKVGFFGNTDEHSVVCSAEHLWPVRLMRQGTTWKTAEWLYNSKIQTKLLYHFVEPWEVDTSWEGGYISGILDGEGCLSFTGRGAQVTFSQNPGPVADRALGYIKQKGYTVTDYEDISRKVECVTHTIGGIGRAPLHIVGTFRPAKWLPNAHKLWQGRRKFTNVEIEHIERVGEREVVSIETTTGTFVTEGLLTHNSLTLASKKIDDNVYVSRQKDYFDLPRKTSIDTNLLKYNIETLHKWCQGL